jgi:hypothetical protein
VAGGKPDDTKGVIEVSRSLASLGAALGFLIVPLIVVFLGL